MRNLVKETGLSVIAAKNQLVRLGEQVTRATRGHQFFLIVAPECRATGAPPSAWWFEDDFGWLGHPYYLGLQSAAAETHGTVPQALQVTQVVTDTPRPEIKMGCIRVRFFVKRGVNRTPTQPLGKAFAPLRVSTPAATAFDLIRYATGLGGLEGAVESLAPPIALIRVPDLKAVLRAEEEQATAHRLGYVLEIAGKAELADTVQEWPSTGLNMVPLSSSQPGSAAGLCRRLAVPTKEREWWQSLWAKLLAPVPNCDAVENRPVLR